MIRASIPNPAGIHNEQRMLDVATAEGFKVTDRTKVTPDAQAVPTE